ncbi:MAG: TetR family transcriptional regulator [Rhodococcus sp. (in: high G+C Gram-positive bacteria)]
MSPKAHEPLQQRMKDKMRSEVVETTIGLFLDKGFDETTVEEICTAAGISRRTFFRYFRGKEDVVVSRLSKLAEDGCHCFVERPVDEDGWTGLRMSMTPFEEWAHGNPARALALYHLIEDAPSLRASYLDRVDRWRASLATVISTKFDLDPRTDLEAAVIAAASVGAYLAATRAWAESGGNDSLPGLFDRAFNALRPEAPQLWG